MTRLVAIQQRLDTFPKDVAYEYQNLIADVECLLRIAQAAQTYLALYDAEEPGRPWAEELREALAALDPPQGAAQ